MAPHDKFHLCVQQNSIPFPSLQEDDLLSQLTSWASKQGRIIGKCYEGQAAAECTKEADHLVTNTFSYLQHEYSPWQKLSQENQTNILTATRRELLSKSLRGNAPQFLKSGFVPILITGAILGGIVCYATLAPGLTSFLILDSFVRHILVGAAMGGEFMVASLITSAIMDGNYKCGEKVSL